MRKITLEGAPAKQALGRWDSFDYLLPEARKTWILAQVAPEAAGKSFTVTALTDQGSFRADVKNICS